MSEQLTPPSRMMRTPEERKKANEEALQLLFNAELTFQKLDQMSQDYVTKRRVGRPAGAYGPYKKKSEDIEDTAY
jgi:hypothetical protein